MNTTPYRSKDNDDERDIQALTTNPTDGIDERTKNDRLQIGPLFSAFERCQDSTSELERNREWHSDIVKEATNYNIRSGIPKEQLLIQCLPKILDLINNIRNDIIELKNNFEEIRVDVTEIRGEMAEIQVKRQDMDELKIKQENCSQDISEIKRRNKLIFGKRIAPKT